MFHPKKGYENGLSEMITVSKRRLNLETVQEIITSLGCTDEYTIWFVGDMDRFDEDAISIEEEDDFYDLVALTATTPVVHVVIQHKNGEEEERGISKRKSTAVVHLASKKPRVRMF